MSIKSSKQLIIAEKPSVARDLVEAMNETFSNHKNYYESSSYIVSYAVGHLLAICSPPEMDENYKSWSLDILPILPKEFLLKKNKYTQSQLAVLKKLIQRKDVSCIINACDAGREGELIFRYILQYVDISKRKEKIELKRLWLQSMTKKSIQVGFQNIRGDAEMKNLESAALSRSESDWLVGINSSRALTGWKSRFGGFFLTPCGRVQTPTLSMIVAREMERNNFKSKRYWEISILLNCVAGQYEAKWFDTEFKKDKEEPHQKVERIWQLDKVTQITKEVKAVKNITVEEVTKPTQQNSPILYDLTSLQREANSRFGFSAKMTLDIMQGLYEKHKVITYPRTGARYLPSDYLGTVESVLKNLSHGKWGRFADKALKEKWVVFIPKVFNDKKVTDHHAVIPTDVSPKVLSETEQKIYDMIVQRFCAVFYPAAKYLNTTRITKVDEHQFKTEGKVLDFAGWKEIYGNQLEESTLAPLQDKEVVKLDDITVLDNQTKPPARFTESTLLTMLEFAGRLVEDAELKEVMKEGGLGTPATRASIIEGLINDKYVSRNLKELVPTSKSFELIETLQAMELQELLSPEMTGRWESKLQQIQDGTINREQFMQEISEFTSNIVSKIKSFDDEKESLRSKVFNFEDQDFYQSLSYYENQEKSVRIRRYLGGRLLKVEEVQELLKSRKIGPFSDFISKSRKAFSAILTLTKENKIEFIFDESDEKSDFSTMNCVGLSPVDQTKVYEGDMGYVSTSYYEEDEKKAKDGLKISKVILGQTITPENMSKMLTDGKSDLIGGFISNKTKRKFDAFLLLSNKGKISFAFPERKKSFSKFKKRI